MRQRAIRLSDTTFRSVCKIAKREGFGSASAYIRNAVEQRLASSDEGTEESVTATLNQIRVDLSHVNRDLQTLFAFEDTLAKTVLTALPEQTSPSVARGKERYERFLKNAAAALLDGLPARLRNGGEQ